MKLSTHATYGLKACFLIAIDAQEVVPITSLVRMTGISQKYLEQILLKLRRAKILESVRGASGGYKLNKPANKLTVGEILKVLEGDIEIANCNNNKCNDMFCPNKSIFNKINQKINEVVYSFTLEDMINDSQQCKGIDK